MLSYEITAFTDLQVELILMHVFDKNCIWLQVWSYRPPKKSWTIVRHSVLENSEITPPVQTLLKLEAVLHWEWQQIPHLVLPLQFKEVTQNEVLKLIVFDSTNFRRH